MGKETKTGIARWKRHSGVKGPSPSRKKGDRNVFCQRYSQCLDVAILKSWEKWSCIDCKFRKQAHILDDYPATNSETVLYYTLPRGVLSSSRLPG